MQRLTNQYKYPSNRNLVYGKKGMAATSHPLAAEAGRDILRDGGNAVDAAVAMAAALTVLEPTSNGIGGDAFAIFAKDGNIFGLNASGPSPASITAEAVRNAGHKAMPVKGPLPVNVPGVPGAWAELNRLHGRMPLSDVLAPAIMYAREGAPVGCTVSHNWQKAAESYDQKNPLFQSWFSTFTKDGRAPMPGELFVLPDHADTLEEIGRDPLSFYKGALAEKIADYVGGLGGYLTRADLSSYAPEWVDPIETAYRGYRVLEIPPNGHGIVVLMALQILNEMPETDDETLYAHYMIEAVKIAFSDAMAYVTEPRAMTVGTDRLLDAGYAKARAKLIGPRAGKPEPGQPLRGGTVYLCAADEDGTMISYIQSNYMGFGSGLVVPGTGIALHNRGANFSLLPGHPNELAGGKRPYHTIIPGFLMKGDVPVGPFGVMGAFMQPQGHVQVLSALFRDKENPQEALDRPRFQWIGEDEVLVEEGYPETIVQALQAMGHRIRYSDDVGSFGRGQIILRDEAGVYTGATERRCDGHVGVR